MTGIFLCVLLPLKYVCMLYLLQMFLLFSHVPCNVKYDNVPLVLLDDSMVLFSLMMVLVLLFGGLFCLGSCVPFCLESIWGPCI